MILTRIEAITAETVINDAAMQFRYGDVVDCRQLLIEPPKLLLSFLHSPPPRLHLAESLQGFQRLRPKLFLRINDLEYGSGIVTYQVILLF